MRKISLSSLLFVSLSLLGLPASAQTPDGLTPAVEPDCNPLKLPGTTKALYGLCVAFCEAQDLPAISLPITKAQHQKLLELAPAARILANYNKKRDPLNPLDIEMPCLKKPCPCFSTKDLDRINLGTNENPVLPICDNPAGQISLAVPESPGANVYTIQVTASLVTSSDQIVSCALIVTNGTNIIIPGNGLSITDLEAEACYNLIQDRATSLGVSC